MLELLSGALGGSAIGAIGAAFSKWHDAKTRLKEKELDIQRDQMLNDHELKMHEAQTKAFTTEMEYKGLQASHESDKATYSVGKDSFALTLVDVVRGLVRPLLTFLLLAYCMGTLFYLTESYEVSLGPEQVYDLIEMIVNNLVVCSGIALSWWFGSRTSDK